MRASGSFDEDSCGPQADRCPNPAQKRETSDQHLRPIIDDAQVGVYRVSACRRKNKAPKQARGPHEGPPLAIAADRLALHHTLKGPTY